MVQNQLQWFRNSKQDLWVHLYYSCKNVQDSNPRNLPKAGNALADGTSYEWCKCAVSMF